MNSSLQTFPIGSLGVDKTGAPIPSSSAQMLASTGYKFAFRSIGVPTSGPSQQGALTAQEAQWLGSAGLGVGAFQLNFMTTTVSAAQGTADGQFLVDQAGKIGFPQGALLWFDLEGSFQNASAQALLDYVNAWSDAVIAGGYAAGLYNGKQSILTGTDISNLPNIHAYWLGGGYISVTMPVRGYQVYQLWPLAVTVAGTVVDVDVLQTDFYGANASFWVP